MKPEPTPPSTQLAICLYRLAHGCILMTTGDLFGVVESTAHVIFIEVCKAIVLKMYDEFVYLPKNVEEWRKELQNLLGLFSISLSFSFLKSCSESLASKLAFISRKPASLADFFKASVSSCNAKSFSSSASTEAKYFSSVFVHWFNFFLTLCLFRSYAAAILTRLRRHHNQDHRSSASIEGLIDVAQEATLEISHIICLLPFLYLQTDNSVNLSDYASISTN